MKLVVNFKSVVILGGFNPNILSPSFLHDRCQFRSSQDPKGQTTPVVSELVFGHTQFLMELSKFQVMVKDIDNFSELFPLDIAIKYLEVLEYTPLQMLGVNFSYEMSELQTKAISDALKNPGKIGAVLGMDPDSITLGLIKRSSSEFAVKEFSLAHQIDTDIKNSVRITVNENSVSINNNFEVNRLDESRNRLKIIAERYEEIVELDRTLVNTIKGIGV